jgi:hypothetical protein
VDAQRGSGGPGARTAAHRFPRPAQAAWEPPETEVLFLLEIAGRQIGYFESREAAAAAAQALTRIYELPVP